MIKLEKKSMILSSKNQYARDSVWDDYFYNLFHLFLSFISLFTNL